jgi:hypothetical protein
MVAIGAALAGCTIGQSQMTWMRHDGTQVDTGFHFVAAECRVIAEKVGKVSPKSQRAELTAAAMNGCMAQHGYYWRCAHPIASLADGACLKFQGVAPALETPEGDDPTPAKPAKRQPRPEP